MAERLSVYRRALRGFIGNTTGIRTDRPAVLMGATTAVKGSQVLIGRPVDGSLYLPPQDLDPGSPTFGLSVFVADVDVPDRTGTYFYR